MVNKAQTFEVRKFRQRNSRKFIQRAGVYVLGRADGTLVNHNGETVGTYRILGYGTRRNKKLRRDEQVQLLACTIKGHVVPCYRKDSQYPVHQDFSLKAVKV